MYTEVLKVLHALATAVLLLLAVQLRDIVIQLLAR
jgi:hypothetical protein